MRYMILKQDLWVRRNTLVLSASQIKMFIRCPQLYYISYVEGKKSFTDPYTIAGSALHKTIERYFSDRVNIFFEFGLQFESLIGKEIESGTLKHPEKIQLAQRRGIQRLTKLRLDQFNPQETELEFLLPFQGVQIRGFIDVISDDCIIDHKSSSKLPSHTERANDPQFVLYAWAYNQLYGRMPEKVYWHHLEDGKLYECDVFTDFDVKMQTIEAVAQKIIAADAYPKKQRDSFCDRVCDHTGRCWG
jgi:RecB family exonuclease